MKMCDPEYDQSMDALAGNMYFPPEKQDSVLERRAKTESCKLFDAEEPEPSILLDSVVPWDEEEKPCEADDEEADGEEADDAMDKVSVCNL